MNQPKETIVARLVVGFLLGSVAGFLCELWAIHYGSSWAALVRWTLGGGILCALGTSCWGIKATLRIMSLLFVIPWNADE